MRTIMREKLNGTQREKLEKTLNMIRNALSNKILESNSEPVYFKINMNQGGFRSVEQFTQKSMGIATV